MRSAQYAKDHYEIMPPTRFVPMIVRSVSRVVTTALSSRNTTEEFMCFGKTQAGWILNNL